MSVMQWMHNFLLLIHELEAIQMQAAQELRNPNISFDYFICKKLLNVKHFLDFFKNSSKPKNTFSHQRAIVASFVRKSKAAEWQCKCCAVIEMPNHSSIYLWNSTPILTAILRARYCFVSQLSRAVRGKQCVSHDNWKRANVVAWESASAEFAFETVKKISHQS